MCKKSTPPNRIRRLRVKVYPPTSPMCPAAKTARSPGRNTGTDCSVALSHGPGIAPASAGSGNILIPASRFPAAACPRRCSPLPSAPALRYPSSAPACRSADSGNRRSPVLPRRQCAPAGPSCPDRCRHMSAARPRALPAADGTLPRQTGC